MEAAEARKAGGDCHREGSVAAAAALQFLPVTVSLFVVNAE